MEGVREALQRDGFAIIPGAVEERTVAQLTAVLEPILSGVRRRGGVRHLLEKVPEVRALGESTAVRSIVAAALGPAAFAVRGILFDKTPEANWKVAWHQDLTIAVREKRERSGFGPWSLKDGVVHVQPPVEILERMLAVRVHLDECTVSDGPLRVIPGSHRHGRLDPAGIEYQRSHAAEVTCPVGKGGIVAFHPLLLHASSPAAHPSHRRIVHLEFASCELQGHEWYERS